MTERMIAVPVSVAEDALHATEMCVEERGPMYEPERDRLKTALESDAVVVVLSRKDAERIRSLIEVYFAGYEQKSVLDRLSTALAAARAGDDA